MIVCVRLHHLKKHTNRGQLETPQVAHIASCFSVGSTYDIINVNPIRQLIQKIEKECDEGTVDGMREYGNRGVPEFFKTNDVYKACKKQKNAVRRLNQRAI